MDEMVQVVVNGQTMKWYRSRGYEIPVVPTQVYMTYKGKRIKNGLEHRVPRGTTIYVKRQDLKPNSNKVLTFVCETCGKDFTTTWGAHKKKMSNNCCSCQAKKGFKGGCHSYWVENMITNNPDAKCDISGETDKRFLILHHLLSRSLGGKDAQGNYVILSANYHMAFHNSLGGSNTPCRPEDYFNFKSRELAIDWELAE